MIYNVVKNDVKEGGRMLTIRHTHTSQTMTNITPIDGQDVWFFVCNIY